MGDVFRDPFEQQIELTEEQQASSTDLRTLFLPSSIV